MLIPNFAYKNFSYEYSVLFTYYVKCRVYSIELVYINSQISNVLFITEWQGRAGVVF